MRTSEFYNSSMEGLGRSKVRTGDARFSKGNVREGACYSRRGEGNISGRPQTHHIVKASVVCLEACLKTVVSGAENQHREVQN